MFASNQTQLNNAVSRIAKNQNIFCLLGGSCSGKSSAAKILAQITPCGAYDMDAAIFGNYLGKYDAKRHPANRAWLFADNPLNWSLSLSWEEFDNLNKAANAEYLDLLAQDITVRKSLLIIDGGFSYPAMLVKAIPTQRLICLKMDETERAQIWETAESKKAMKEMIFKLPEPQRKWDTFLLFDKLLTETIYKECEESGIKFCERLPTDTAQSTAEKIAAHFGLTISDNHRSVSSLQ